MYQGRPRWELELGRTVCLPVEGNLVDYWDLKTGDLGLAVFLAESGMTRSKTCKTSNVVAPIKKYLGGLARHCQGPTILAEGDVRDCVRVFFKRLTTTGLPYFQWRLKLITKRRGFTLFFSNNFWVLSLCSCCMAVPVVSQNLTEPSACPVTGKMNSQLLKLQDELSLT